MRKLKPRILLRNLVLELIIYASLIFAYYLVVLRWLVDWLLNLFNTDLVVYAIAGLSMIFVQAVILDFVTSYLMKFIKLDQFGTRRFLDVFSDR